MDRHSKLFFITSLFIALTAHHNAWADASGRTGDSGAIAGRDCARSGCHTPGATVPTVSFSGPQTVQVNSTNTYMFTITGGPGLGAGFDVSTSAGGILAATSSGTQLRSSEVTHTAPAPLSGGSVTFSFSWTAPATNGTYTLYGAGLSADSPAASPGGRTGDGTALATFNITVGGAVNQPPTAAITGPTSGSAGTALNFSGTGSSDPDGTIASYTWDFGDGTAGSGATTSHSFAAGNYNVTLTVTDNAGATGTATTSIVITTPTTQFPPIANAGGPYSGTAGNPVQFDGSKSSDPDGTITAYAWTFGDGGTASVASPTYTYAAAGTYNVILKVTDNSGASSQSISVANIAATGGGGGTPPTDPPPAIGGPGADLYAANCEECHGPGGVGGEDGDVIGASADDISNAIDTIDEMSFLKDVLEEDDIDDIAQFLKAALGAQLYATNCEECHGAGGIGGPDGDVIGADAEDIKNAIEDVDEMNFLDGVLSKDEVGAIGAYLKPLGGEDDESIDADSGGPKPARPPRAAKSNSTATASLDLLALSIIGGLAAVRRRRRQ